MIRTLAFIAALLMAGLAGTAGAQTAGYTTTTQLDGYIPRTFGAQFKASGPVEILKPETTAKRDRLWNRVTLLRIPVTYARTARLDHDLTLPATRRGETIILKAGTALHHAAFRRLATDTDPFEAWCGNTSFAWGFNRDKTGYDMVCLTRTADGRGMAFRSPPNIVWYTNGTSKTVFNESPLDYTFLLDDIVPQTFDYPAITEGETDLPKLMLTLQLHPPQKAEGPKSQEAAAVWMLSKAGQEVYSQGYIVLLPDVMSNNHIRIGIGNHIIDADYDFNEKAVKGTRISEGYLPPALDGLPGPMEYQGGDLFAWYAPLPDTRTEVADTPWRFGAMAAAPGDVTLNEGILKKGDVLLSAKVALKDRYKVTRAPERSLGVTMVSVGDHVYAYEETRYGADGAPYRHRFWCSSALNKALLVTEYVGMCTPHSTVEALGSPSLKAWEINAFNDTPYGGDYWRDIGYAPDPDPAPTAETLHMRIWSFDKTPSRVEVRTGLMRGEQFLGVRSYLLPFDADGVAILNLWDKAVRLQRQDTTVTATIIPGNGKGPASGSVVWDHDP